MVGRGGLSRVNLAGQDRLEVGWTVRADLWGRGYATEIGRAGLAFAWDDCGAAEVVAFTENHNRRSRAVMERLGMSYARSTIAASRSSDTRSHVPQRRVAASEPDQRLARVGHVRDAEHRRYDKQVITGLQALAGLTLQRGQATLGDQRTGLGAAEMRHVVEQQPGARPALSGEPPGERTLGRAQDGHPEPADPAEHLGRVGIGDQRDEHQRWRQR